MTTEYSTSLSTGLIAETLRRHADSSIAEYIDCVRGRGSLSLAQLAVRLWSLNQVVDELLEIRPAFAQQLPRFELQTEIRNAFDTLQANATVAPDRSSRTDTQGRQ